MAIAMRDEEVLLVEPEGIVGYSYSASGGAPETLPYR